MLYYGSRTKLSANKHRPAWAYILRDDPTRDAWGLLEEQVWVGPPVRRRDGLGVARLSIKPELDLYMGFNVHGGRYLWVHSLE